MNDSRTINRKDNRSNPRTPIPILLGLVLATTIAIGAPQPRKTYPAPKLTIENTPIDRSLPSPISFAPVAKKVAPSVVNIYSKLTLREQGSDNPFFNDPFLRRFFGNPFGENQPRERHAESLGSGVIVSADGYILTANHVVEGADSVKVGLSTGEKEFVAKVIGTDPLTDIAVLKIESSKPFQPIVIANSDKLEVGDLVLAVGNPFAVGQTITLGLVSALSRSGLGISGFEDFIQTDAAINPGNSGGALVDVQGRLVGINTAIVSRSGGFQGIGFAVPSDLARFVMDRLITTGKVERGYLGINIQPMTPDLAREFKLPADAKGVLVGGVSPGGPAAKGGLKEGDLILNLDGKELAAPRDLQLNVAAITPGTKVKLHVLRSGDGGKTEPRDLVVTLGELPKNLFGGQPGSPDQGSATADALDGVEVTDLDARVRRQMSIPANIQGALVSNVDENSNAAEAGLRAGDVILEINRTPVRSAEQAVDLSNKATGDRILLRVWSGGQGRPGGTRYLVVDNTKQQ